MEQRWEHWHQDEKFWLTAAWEAPETRLVYVVCGEFQTYVFETSEEFVVRRHHVQLDRDRF